MSGRAMRYLVAAGTRRYREASELPGAHEDVERAVELFTSMGYERILRAVSYDPASAEFEDALADWCRTADLTADDVVVVYYAGHGDRSLSGQYRLACANSAAGNPRSYLSLRNLAEILATSPARSVLFVVDSCHAAAATGEIAPVTNALVSARGRNDGFGAGTWLLASARHRDLADDGAFVAELAKACAQGDGPSQRYLSPSVLADRVNHAFVAEGLPQRAACSSVDHSEPPPFFDNPSFDPYAEIAAHGGVLGDAADLASHFEPRGRGVEHVHDEGDYFTGRARALREARARLTGEGRGSLLVVTADPGSGKSAVLGRLVREGHADVSVNAHHLTLETVVGRLAAAADVQATTPVALFTALAARDRPFRVVVDSLDEAGPGGDKAEARRIAWELLRPLAAVNCVRLLVGSRRELLPHLGDRPPVIDLDDDAYTEDTDAAEYVEKILRDRGAPYAGRPEVARLVSGEVARRAGRCFLVARMTAGALLRSPVIDVGVPGWTEQLPSDVGGAFEAYLQRVPAARQQTTAALLTTLVFGEGEGLPRKIWVRVAARLSGLALVEADVDTLLEEDGSYLARVRVDGVWVFRAYHQALTDYVKDRALRGRDLADIQECFVDTLLELVPERDWSRAHPYVRRHLATHAAGGGVLDDLIEDAAYVLEAEPSTLLPAVRHAVRRMTLSMAVERYLYLLGDEDPARLDRAALLAFVARGYGEHPLAREAERLSSSMARLCVEPREITPHRVVGRHAGDGYSVSFLSHGWRIRDVVLPDGRRAVFALSPRDSVVHAWLIDSPAQSTVLPIAARVRGLTVLAGAARPPEIVTLDAAGTLQCWNAADQTLVRTLPDTGWTQLFDAGYLADGSQVVVCGNDERVAALSLPDLRPLAEVACTTRREDGRGEFATGTGCLAVGADGHTRLLLCDGAAGRLTLHCLEEPGDPVVLLDGLDHPLLGDRVHGPRGTVAAVEEPLRLSLFETGSGRTTATPGRVNSWDRYAFAYGGDGDPVLVTLSPPRIVLRIGAAPRRVTGAGNAIVYAPVLHDDELFAVTTGFGGDLTVVNHTTGRAVGPPLRGHESAVCAIHVLPAPGTDGPDVLTVGNDGTARLWPWGAAREGPTTVPSGARPETTLPLVKMLAPWPGGPNAVTAVTGGAIRRVVADLSDTAQPAPSHSPVEPLAASSHPGVPGCVEDRDGTLHLLSWQYSEVDEPDIASDPAAYAVWYRLRPDRDPERTELSWLQGDVGTCLDGWLIPPAGEQSPARLVGFDGALNRVTVLDAPDGDGEWTDLPWSVDPTRDSVCATAFATGAGDVVLMAAARPALPWESTVGGYDVSGPPGDEATVTSARLWNVTRRTWHRRDPVALDPDVCHLLPHHGRDGTKWVMQCRHDGSASVIDIESGRRLVVHSAEKAGVADPLGFHHDWARWTELPDGTPVLLYPIADEITEDGEQPVIVWQASAPDRPARLPLPVSEILWAGPAPSGEALVAVSSTRGITLCHLAGGETVWHTPLPAQVTALVPLRGSTAFDLAVGTQQGVVFLRPRFSPAWRDVLGIT
ncbi:caspase family protein [Streptomyces sp. UH6]|uniref:caspase family protein n=1 Tax=Streptomyces sp. UH6 TaxID=2748379 RepID=UPI0015D4E58A|nr:caspase family protein [Streptomyces sp. UH6]NYV73776.1 caspase family protein [Streptomyces sp. UH6]